MDSSEAQATLGTQDTGPKQTKQKTQHRKLKRWATPTTPKTKNGGEHMLANGKQFLSLIRHQPCYSYSQKVLDTIMCKQTQDKVWT